MFDRETNIGLYIIGILVGFDQMDDVMGGMRAADSYPAVGLIWYFLMFMLVLFCVGRLSREIMK